MIIYQATNIINGKFYIGLTKQVLNRRRGCHIHLAKHNPCGFFHLALAKYGLENFKWEIIDNEATSYEDLKERERYYILLGKPQYNLTKGGDGSIGRKTSLETKLKISKANKGNKYCLGYKHTPEMLLNQSIAQKKRVRTQEEIDRWRFGALGCKHSLESRKIMSEKMKGRVRSKEHCEAISKSKTGKKWSIETKLNHKVSEETKKKVSEGLKRYYSNNTVSEETRLKISLAGKGRRPWNKKD